MEYEGDRWVQRLRDGVVPRPWTVLVSAALLTLGGTAALVGEFSGPAFFAHVTRPRAEFWVVAFPAFLVVLGLAIIIGTWRDGRRDRRTLDRIRQSGRQPAFFLPVSTRSLRTSEDLPRPRPALWTIDDSGIHGWVPQRATAVVDVPWSAIRSVDLATKDRGGVRTDYGLWFGTTNGGSLVLAPRTTLGRPFSAGQTGLDVLMRVIRSLRRELDR